MEISKREWFSYAGVAVALLFLCILSGLKWKAALLIMAAAAVLIVLDILISKNKIRLSGRVFAQLLPIACIGSAFVLSALLSPYTEKDNVKWVLLDCVIVFGATAVIAKGWFKKQGLPWRSAGFAAWAKAYIKTHVPELILIGLVVATRIWMVDTYQSWDAGEYYYRLGTACDKFDFTPGEYLEYFRLAQHPTLGYAGVMAIGEFLNLRGVVGVMLVNLVITAMAVVYLYRMLAGFFGNMSKTKAAVGAGVALLVPLFWGTFGYFQPDYGTCIFAIFTMYFDYKKKPILFFFWAVMLTQSKEVGIVVLAGYMVARLIYGIAANKGTGIRRIGVQLRDPINWCAVGSAAVFGVYSLINGGASTWTQYLGDTSTSIFSWSNTGTNCFGFQPTYIVERLEQMFVMNYSWLLFVFISAGLIAFFIKKARKRETVGGARGMACLFGAVAAFTLMYCLFITELHYRYSIVFALLIWVAAYVGLQEILGERKIPCVVAAAVVAVLFSMQTFMSVDPVSNALIDTVDVGNGRMLIMRKAYDTGTVFGDQMVYNYQFAHLNKALDGMMEKAGIEKGCGVIYSRGSSITGQLSGGAYHKSYWSADKNARVSQKDGSTSEILTYGIHVLEGNDWYQIPNKAGAPDSADCYSSLPEKGVVYFMPFFGADEKKTLELLSDYYYIGEAERETEGAVGITYYTLYKKPLVESAAWSIAEQDLNECEEAKKPTYSTDEMELSEYDSCKTEPRHNPVTEKTLRQEAVSYLGEYAKKPKDGRTVVREGDSVYVEIQSYIDDERYVEEYSFNVRVGKTLYIGSGKYEDDVDMQLVGHRIGERVAVKCTFPENYTVEPAFAGKTVTLKVSLKSIAKELPELDKSFFEKYGTKIGAVNLSEFEDRMRERLEKKQLAKAKLAVRERIMPQLYADSVLKKADEEILEDMAENFKKYYQDSAKRADMKLLKFTETYLDITTEEDFDSFCQYLAKKKYKYEMMINAVILNEGKAEEYLSEQLEGETRESYAEKLIAEKLAAN